MPPGRKPTRSQEEFVDEAIRFADEHGISALTLRALGSAMGASTTAVYRYFTDKEALFSAMRDALLDDALAGVPRDAEPMAVLTSAALAYRDTARRHPCLSQLMALGRLEGPTAAAIPSLIAQALDDLGLAGSRLLVAYRQLESFVVGTCAFDFADAPDHLRSRQVRMQAVDRADFQSAFGSTSAVEDINEEAFRASLDALLGTLVDASDSSE